MTHNPDHPAGSAPVWEGGKLRGTTIKTVYGGTFNNDGHGIMVVAADHPAGGAGAVKPLVWDKSYGYAGRAETAIGVYAIEHFAGQRQAFRVSLGMDRISSHAALDTAQAAAQADYEARILSALAPVPEQNDGGQRIIDGLNDVLAYCAGDTSAATLISRPPVPEPEAEGEAVAFIAKLVNMQSGAGWSRAVIRDAAARFLHERGLKVPNGPDSTPEMIRKAASEAEIAGLRAERDRMRQALEWYGEQARLARLIHSEGDAGRHALANDGGKRAHQALAGEEQEKA